VHNQRLRSGLGVVVQDGLELVVHFLFPLDVGLEVGKLVWDGLPRRGPWSLQRWLVLHKHGVIVSLMGTLFICWLVGRSDNVQVQEMG
jgi:hypothetical protein